MRTWADEFNTYEEACYYYGCDTPAQAEEEARYYAELACIERQDEIEARGPTPEFRVAVGPPFEIHPCATLINDDYIPF